MNYGRAIRVCCAARNMSKTALAARAGLSVSFVGLACQDKRPVAPDTLEKIAAALGCSTLLLRMLAGHTLPNHVLIWRGIAGLMTAAEES